MLTQVSERCFLTCGYLVLICREGARPGPDVERHIVGVVGMLQRAFEQVVGVWEVSKSEVIL